MSQLSEQGEARSRLIKLLSWVHSRAGRRVLRYGMVSVVSVGVSMSVLFLVFGVFNLMGEVASTVFANLVAAFPSYYLNRNWVWGRSGRSHWRREVVPFWIMVVVGLVASMAAAWLAARAGQALAHWEQTALVLAANIVTFGILWVAKLFLFGRIFTSE